MCRVCSRPQVNLVVVQNPLSWPERTACVKREARYRKRCIAAQRQRLWGFAQICGPLMHPTQAEAHLDKGGWALPTLARPEGTIF
jgi:hypothetical protein